MFLILGKSPADNIHVSIGEIEMLEKQMLLFKSKTYRREFGDLVSEGLDPSWMFDESEGDESEEFPWTEQDAREFALDFELAVDMLEFALTERQIAELEGIEPSDVGADNFLGRFKSCSGYESVRMLG